VAFYRLKGNLLEAKRPPFALRFIILDFVNIEDSEIDLFINADKFLIPNYAVNVGKSGILSVCDDKTSTIQCLEPYNQVILSLELTV